MYRYIGLFVLTWTLNLGFVGTTWAASPTKATAKKKKKPGFKFPAHVSHFQKVPYFQYKSGATFQKKTFSFQSVVGKKPFVMFYFLPNAKPTLTELKAYATASKIFAGKVQFFAVTKGTTKDDVAKAWKKIKELKVQIPVLLDEKGLLAYVMLTRRVPAYAVVTKKGFVTLARGGALTEKINPKDTLLGLISRVAAGEETPFVVAPGYSPNPYNLVGKKAKMFKAVNALGPDKMDLQEYVKQDKRPVLLAFWSVTCPHCQKTMPLLQKYANTNKKRMRMVTMAVIHKADYKAKLQTYLKKHKLTFKVYNDPKGKVFNSYKIMTVPTLFLLDSQGVIRNAVLGGGGKKPGKVLDQLLKQMEKPAKPSTQPASRPTPRR